MITKTQLKKLEETDFDQYIEIQKTLRDEFLELDTESEILWARIEVNVVVPGQDSVRIKIPVHVTAADFSSKNITYKDPFNWFFSTKTSDFEIINHEFLNKMFD